MTYSKAEAAVREENKRLRDLCSERRYELYGVREEYAKLKKDYDRMHEHLHDYAAKLNWELRVRRATDPESEQMVAYMDHMRKEEAAGYVRSAFMDTVRVKGKKE
jgi:hypothetical protein